MNNNVWYLAALAASCLICTFAAYWTGWSNARRTNRNIERTMRGMLRETSDWLEDSYQEIDDLWEEIERLRDYAADTTAGSKYYRLTPQEQAKFRKMINGDWGK